jgi:FixJ family two-component response regulator
MFDTIPDVYVVDDDEPVRKSLERLLRSSGLYVRTFASAEDYLHAKVPAPGCLLLDVLMPGMTGLELQAHLRKAGSQIPIILMTAQEDLRVRAEALAGGAVAVLQKPLEEKLLLGAIDRALGRPESGAVPEGTVPATVLRNTVVLTRKTYRLLNEEPPVVSKWQLNPHLLRRGGSRSWPRAVQSNLPSGISAHKR